MIDRNNNTTNIHSIITVSTNRWCFFLYMLIAKVQRPPLYLNAVGMFIFQLSSGFRNMQKTSCEVFEKSQRKLHNKFAVYIKVAAKLEKTWTFVDFTEL